jgi:hypothetical protein
MKGRELEEEIDLGLDEDKLENKAPKLGTKKKFLESVCDLA